MRRCAAGAARRGYAGLRHVGAGRVRATLRFHQLGLWKRVRGWRGLGPGAQYRPGAASRRRGGAGGAALHPHPRPGPRRLRGGHAVPPHRGSGPRLRPPPGGPAPSFPAPLASLACPLCSGIRWVSTSGGSTALSVHPH